MSLSAENGKGQSTPEHRRLARSTSNPLCKTAERAGADGDRKEGQKERKDQSGKEAVQGRGLKRQSVSGSKPAAVSASLLLLSSSASSASASLREAASSSQLPSTVVGRQRRLLSESALTRGRSAAAAKEEAQRAKRAQSAQRAQPRPQPRPQQYGLLAKGVRLLRNMGNQETKQKKGGGSGGAAGDVSCEGDADEVEVDKKSKRSHSKTSKGEHSGKKKSKSESKGSVFSGIRKSLSKAKGLSKEDMLEDGRSAHVGKAGLKHGAEGNLSTDEMGMLSDVEGDLGCLNTESRQSVDELGRKGSSGSDADVYSFHSVAAENEDLLSDIQKAMREQCAASDGELKRVNGQSSQGSTSEATKAHEKLLDMDKEFKSGSKAQERKAKKKVDDKSSDLPISSNSSGPGSPSESGPSSSAADTERSSGSVFPKTNSTYSFPDTATTTTSYESAEEPQDDLESPVFHPEQGQGNRAAQGVCVPSVRLDPVVAGPGPHKSVSSMELSMEREEREETGRWDFLSLKRRKSSMSNNQLTADGSQPRRTSSSSPSTVKLYPPVHPSYVKTTTRQLTSPIGSPITSPHVPRKTEGTDESVEYYETPGLRRRKQRSCSIGGPVTGSADWCTEVDEHRGRQGVHFPEQEAPERSHAGGTYWTLGSRRAQYGRHHSTTTGPYLDVFSGESHVKHVTDLLPHKYLESGKQILVNRKKTMTLRVEER